MREIEAILDTLWGVLTFVVGHPATKYFVGFAVAGILIVWGLSSLFTRR